MSLTRSARGTLENPGQGVTIKAAANRTMLEQTWGEFAQILTYKAEGAGMSVVRVDPAYTSLTCSRCGVANLMHRDKRGTGFGSGVLIAAVTSIGVSMPRRTYW